LKFYPSGKQANKMYYEHKTRWCLHIWMSRSSLCHNSPGKTHFKAYDLAASVYCSRFCHLFCLRDWVLSWVRHWSGAVHLSAALCTGYLKCIKMFRSFEIFPKAFGLKWLACWNWVNSRCGRICCNAQETDICCYKCYQSNISLTWVSLHMH
jgi:hypothetical protein